MTPDEASEIMSQEADELMRMVRQLRSRKSSDFDNRDLLNWFCMTLQQFANFKQSMSEIVKEMGEKYPEVRLTPQNDTHIVVTDNTNSINIEAPPFDTNFWMGLGDI